MQRERSFGPPVKVGDECSVKIEGAGEKGDGIAKINNFVVFVPGTKEGDQVKIRITKVFKKMAFGEVISKGGADSKAAEAEKEEESAPAPETGSESDSYEDSDDFGEESEESSDEE